MLFDIFLQTKKNKKLHFKNDVLQYAVSRGLAESFVEWFEFRKIYCVCHQVEDPTYDYIECSYGKAGCNGWVHPYCVGLGKLSTQQIQYHPPVICPYCVEHLEGAGQLDLVQNSRKKILRQIQALDTDEVNRDPIVTPNSSETVEGADGTELLFEEFSEPHARFGWLSSPVVFPPFTNKIRLANAAQEGDRPVSRGSAPAQEGSEPPVKKVRAAELAPPPQYPTMSAGSSGPVYGTSNSSTSGGLSIFTAVPTTLPSLMSSNAIDTRRAPVATSTSTTSGGAGTAIPTAVQMPSSSSMLPWMQPGAPLGHGESSRLAILQTVLDLDRDYDACMSWSPVEWVQRVFEKMNLPADPITARLVLNTVSEVSARKKAYSSQSSQEREQPLATQQQDVLPAAAPASTSQGQTGHLTSATGRWS